MSRLPFTIDAQYRAYKLRNVPHTITDNEICYVCASLVIFAATAFGAIAGWML